MAAKKKAAVRKPAPIKDFVVCSLEAFHENVTDGCGSAQRCSEADLQKTIKNVVDYSDDATVVVAKIVRLEVVSRLEKKEFKGIPVIGVTKEEK